MASVDNHLSLRLITIQRAHAEMEMKLNRDPAKQAELERIYNDLRDEETAAKVALRLEQAIKRN